MTKKGTIEKLKIIKDLTTDNSVKAICDILIDLVSAADSGEQFGFSDKKGSNE